MVRTLLGAMFVVLLPAGSASAQSWAVQIAGGPTILDAGYSVAGTIGFTPNDHLTIQAGIERTHIASRTTPFSAFRGGTLTFGTVELRATILNRNRVTPFVLIGAGRGISRPNVNARFPTVVKNEAGVIFFGGGMQFPLGRRFAAFGDFKMVAGAEGTEGIVVYGPLRAGLVWRF